MSIQYQPWDAWNIASLASVSLSGVVIMQKILLVTSQNSISTEIKSKLNLGSACYNIVQNLLSCCLCFIQNYNFTCCFVWM